MRLCRCRMRAPALRGKIEMEDHDIRAALDRHWAASDGNDFEAEHQIYPAKSIDAQPGIQRPRRKLGVAPGPVLASFGAG